MRGDFGPVGIIDIGSNSVRLVVFAGNERVPAPLFNEKVTAGLGRGVARDGAIDQESRDKALTALGRFARVAKAIGVKKLTTVATAAVRDASNGKAFLKEVIALGLKPRLIDGSEEAELAGLGVLSAFPRANGIVADLGGGSLELVGVARGMVGEGVSLPLGVQRIEGRSVGVLRKAIGAGLPSKLLAGAARDHALYLVGGSLRALAQLDLALLDHPLPILHHHRIDPARFGELEKAVSTIPHEELMRSMGISPSRVVTLAPGLAMLRALSEQLEPKRILTSAFGLREGLLYRDLSDAVRREDPLLAASLEAAQRLGRFGDHGALLDDWLSDLFDDDPPEAQRYRLAACLLGDIAWNAHPDFRSERAVDLAIHGNWVGIDAHGRALLGRTLHSAFSGKGLFDRRLAALLRPGEEERAEAWGRAIRLAQRLSGGTEVLLRRTSLTRRGRKVILKLPTKSADLYAAPVERRLVALAKAMDREGVVEFG